MIKSSFSGLANKISYLTGRAFSRVPVSPVAWTLFSIVPASIGVYYMSLHDIRAALLFFILAGALDLIDGAVARFTGKATRFGAFLDGVTDRFVEFLIIFGLFIHGIPRLGLSGDVWLLILLSAGTFMTSFIPAYAAHKKVVFEQELQLIGGILERPERLLVIYISMLAGTYNILWLTAGIAFGAMLAMVTVFQRIRFVARYKEG